MLYWAQYPPPSQLRQESKGLAESPRRKLPESPLHFLASPVRAHAGAQ